MVVQPLLLLLLLSLHTLQAVLVLLLVVVRKHAIKRKGVRGQGVQSWVVLMHLQLKNVRFTMVKRISAENMAVNGEKKTMNAMADGINIFSHILYFLTFPLILI